MSPSSELCTLTYADYQAGLFFLCELINHSDNAYYVYVSRDIQLSYTSHSAAYSSMFSLIDIKSVRFCSIIHDRYYSFQKYLLVIQHIFDRNTYQPRSC